MKHLSNVALSLDGRGGAGIAALFDPGTFTPVGALVKGSAASNGDCDRESVITGYGAVQGRPVFAFVQDGTCAKGAMTVAQAEKICRLITMAVRAKAPLVGLFDGAGADIREGSALLSGYGNLLAALAEASGVIPTVAYLCGPCGGMNAVLASSMDLVLSAPDAAFFLTPPSLRGMDDAASLTSAAEAGKLTVCEGGIAELVRLLSFLPSACGEEAPTTEEADASNPVVLPVGDVDGMMRALFDRADAYPLLTACAPDTRIALGRIGGRVIGMIATDPRVNGGKITPKGTEKACALLKLCRTMHLPVLTLVDSEGLSCDEGNEADAYARLAAAYASFPYPLITAIVGSAIGAAFALLSSRSLGTDMVFALEGCRIGTLSAEAAVEATMRGALKQGEDRVALEKTYAREMLSAERALQSGDIDLILPPEQLRARIAAALEILALKGENA